MFRLAAVDVRARDHHVAVAHRRALHAAAVDVCTLIDGRGVVMGLAGIYFDLRRIEEKLGIRHERVRKGPGTIGRDQHDRARARRGSNE